MKRIIQLLFMVISLSTYATKQDAFQGSWYSDGIVYSFDNDSLYIDELGNEGDVYEYSLKFYTLY